jgi:hypothetical protein
VTPYQAMSSTVPIGLRGDDLVCGRGGGDRRVGAGAGGGQRVDGHLRGALVMSTYGHPSEDGARGRASAR